MQWGQFLRAPVSRDCPGASLPAPPVHHALSARVAAITSRALHNTAAGRSSRAASHKSLSADPSQPAHSSSAPHPRPSRSSPVIEPPSTAAAALLAVPAGAVPARRCLLPPPTVPSHHHRHHVLAVRRPRLLGLLSPADHSRRWRHDRSEQPQPSAIRDSRGAGQQHAAPWLDQEGDQASDQDRLYDLSQASHQGTFDHSPHHTHPALFFPRRALIAGVARGASSLSSIEDVVAKKRELRACWCFPLPSFSLRWPSRGKRSFPSVTAASKRKGLQARTGDTAGDYGRGLSAIDPSITPRLRESCRSPIESYSERASSTRRRRRESRRSLPACLRTAKRARSEHEASTTPATAGFATGLCALSAPATTHSPTRALDLFHRSTPSSYPLG